jgi:ribose/xylose/arabinose/galactoside ABC-type transport system permease subunit
LLSIEEKLRPGSKAPTRPRDAAAASVLLVLGVLMLPPWAVVYPRQAIDVTQPMTSAYLLLSLGMLLALREGAVDLSVWSVSALGGVVAARCICAGAAPFWAFAAAAVVGAALGALHGALVAWARIPSILVTAASALGVMYLSGLVAGLPADQRSVIIPEQAFDHWGPDLPGRLLLTRMLLVAGLYCAVMVALLIADIVAWDAATGRRRAPLFAALSVSGFLAGCGGAVWLLDYGRAPVPTRPVGDLRVPAAVVAAGAALLAGRGRTMLSALLLAPALLLATLWRNSAGSFQREGYELQMLVLTGQVLAVHLAVLAAAARAGPGRIVAIAASAAAGAGLVFFGGAAGVRGPETKTVLHLAGGVLSLCAAGLLALWLPVQRLARPGAPASAK